MTGMIYTWATRSDGPRTVTMNDRHLVTTERALNQLVVYELGYGGFINTFSVLEGGQGVCFSVETRVFSNIDHTWFEGTEESLEPLLRVLKALAHIEPMRDNFISATAKELQRISGGGGIVPLFAAHAGPLILGSSRTKAALILAIDPKDEAEALTMAGFKLEDLCAAWALNNWKADGLADLLVDVKRAG